MTNANAKANQSLEVQKGAAEDLTITINDRDLSGKTCQLRVKNYAGQASYDINIAGTPTYSNPDTVIAFSLSTSNTNLSWSRGVYNVSNLTDDEILLVGEFIVKDYGY